jgi:hypothetical protein
MAYAKPRMSPREDFIGNYEKILGTSEGMMRLKLG